MNESRAREIANVLGGEAWQSGDDTWLVYLVRPDGKFVLMTDESLFLYASKENRAIGLEDAAVGRGKGREVETKLVGPLLDAIHSIKKITKEEHNRKREQRLMRIYEICLEAQEEFRIALGHTADNKQNEAMS